MRNLSRLERWLAGLAAALFVFVATLAAIRLGGGLAPTAGFKDPLKPDAFAENTTGEQTVKRFRNVDLKRAEELAVEQFGPLPPPIEEQSSPEVAQQMQIAAQGLQDLERIQAIRRAQGTKAALKAMKPLPTSSAGSKAIP